MLIAIPDLLDAAQVATIRALIDPADWVDGNITSGPQSAMAKRNLQLPEDCPAARQAGQMILDALGRSPLFIAAALPLKIFPPLFNSYAGGQAFGVHVDNAVRIQAGTGFRVRSDMSMSVFLESPESYDGGELTIETNFGVQQIKLPAGHAVLYPSSSLHRVEPVRLFQLRRVPRLARCRQAHSRVVAQRHARFLALPAVLPEPSFAAIGRHLKVKPP